MIVGSTSYKCRSCGGESFRAWYKVEEGQDIKISSRRPDADGKLDYEYFGNTKTGDALPDEEFWCLDCEDHASTIEELVGLRRDES